MTDVIAQVRAAREAFAAEHGYDVRAMIATLREKSEKAGRTLVSFPPRPASWPVVTCSPVPSPTPPGDAIG